MAVGNKTPVSQLTIKTWGTSAIIFDSALSSLEIIGECVKSTVNL